MRVAFDETGEKQRARCINDGIVRCGGRSPCVAMASIIAPTMRTSTGASPNSRAPMIQVESFI